MRTVVSTVVVLGLLSALIGYLVGDSQVRGRAAGPPAEGEVTGAAAPRVNESGGTGPTSSSVTNRTNPTDTAGRSARSPVAVPENGTGKFSPVAVPQRTTAKTGRVVTYSLEVEGGLHADLAATARDVGDALLDARGWQGVDHVRFEQVTPAQRKDGKKPELVIRLVSPHQVDTQCAPLETHGRTSCATGGHAVLNYRLWMNGVSYFGNDLASYRDYMVNHEVGHTLGHGHQKCPKPGAPAPIMLQQTLGLDGCKPWSWPKQPAAGR
ncbi:DUF3152 domain-containing protein [Flexivirga meconopsidis]|uniref:DUF3152 domain-containing protein n=1 Tax=Flexivirga meconopsidis TaxID=2977121 RepID=UPI00224051AF|nr:DUF3152 domain-containing protein [Flexivirga meconopsidis]